MTAAGCCTLCCTRKPAASTKLAGAPCPLGLRLQQRCSAAAAVHGGSSARKARSRQLPRCAASSGDADPLSSRDDAERLNRLLAGPAPITGEELRQLVLDKWGVSYDVRLQKRGARIYLHVMWRFLEQKSFPLTEEEYEAQLQAVAEYLNLWEVQERVRHGIKTANKRGPGYTGGGNAKAISIPLDVSVGESGRANEWNSF